MTVTLQPVKKTNIHILRNLYSLYLHDLSSYTENLSLEKDGSFHFDDLELFWNVEGFSPFFLKYNDEIIGFLLLIERPFLKKEKDFGVNDIFILNKFRRKGFGLQVLENLFNEKPGKYFVIELLDNKPAVLFWKKVYQQLNIKIVERHELIDDEPCLVQTFSV
ncbi:GNAT family N-acetyltransferase [Sporosarcina sp. BI001-red]|uniref:GNAT family N-acetyltransferase n=1 Tax=Sporosarcina sp. BI001-red TaxID=2282866 RepID=UPI000E27288E|nr:GNAT family N-acetyltransferase [Sporosarcina sp. BI001-red]REB07085.1 GNAT family N-acetyltransferase [Sporosarcina sp. BI001-red]